LYADTTFGSVSAQYERPFQARTHIQQNDGMPPYGGSAQAPDTSGYG
jgi:hypothetical protein